MIIHEVEQNSPEWHVLRAGIPTASEFSNIVTPAKWEPSASQERYLNALVHERRIGFSEDEFQSDDMRWGNEYEQDAVDCYEFQNEVSTVKIGFVTDDRKRYGASPDRFVGEDGLVEIKCPKGSTHVGYMRNRSIEKEKLPQLMGQLLLTGRKYVDIVSYHPKWEPVIIRVERDEQKIETLRTLLESFCDRLDAEWQKLSADTLRNTKYET